MTMIRLRHWAVSAAGLTAAGLLAGGCAAYRLGSTLPKDIRTISVPAFTNRTREPNLETETTAAVLQEFQKDGSLRVADLETADVVLTVTLLDFKMEPLRYEKDRALTAREYRMTIVAEAVLNRARTGEEMMRRTVEGEADFEPSGGLRSSKRRAVPEAARDLAHDVVESVVEYW